MQLGVRVTDLGSSDVTISNDIKNIFESSDFGKDLEEVSCYAAHIRQERPLVHLFAKYFWKRGCKFALEDDKCDLVVDRTRVEFKFHFDSDMRNLRKELNKFGGDLGALWQAVCEEKLSKSWPVSPGIYKDVMVKRPDVFVWILCARDLSNLTKDELSRVCISVAQSRYNRTRPYGSNKEFIEVAEEFLGKLKMLRNFSLNTASVTTTGAFPSAYHLYVCDFSEAENCRSGRGTLA